MKGAQPRTELPLDRLWPDAGAHRQRLARCVAKCGAEIVAGEAFVGGGAAPERPIPGEVLALPGGVARLAALRAGEPAVAGYARGNRCLLDLRTIDPEDDERLLAAVARTA